MEVIFWCTTGVAVIEFSKFFPELATDLPDGTRNNYRDVIDNCMLRSERPTKRSSMDVDSETFTIHAARNGSEQAWRQLFDRHFDAVYRFCLVLTGTRHHLAEELIQQVFVTAARRIHRFDPGRAAFRAWLFGVARNRHMVAKTREQRRKRHEQSPSRGSSETVAQGGNDLWVHEALARLPSHYRIVPDEKYLRGLSMNEIAANNGASVEAIESLLRRARAGFAREYEQLRTLE